MFRDLDGFRWVCDGVEKLDIFPMFSSQIKSYKDHILSSGTPESPCYKQISIPIMSAKLLWELVTLLLATSKLLKMMLSYYGCCRQMGCEREVIFPASKTTTVNFHL
jgi:hypothetical protein